MKRGVQIGLVALAVGVAFGVGALTGAASFEMLYALAIPALATLAAAFFGARYAFTLQNQRSEEESERAKVAAANRAIFSLSRKYNRLRNFHDQFIAPHEGNEAAFLTMLPAVELMKDDILFDIDGISFLLETEHRNLLGEVTISVAKYQTAIDAINLRSRLHLNEAQPLLEQAGVIEGGQYAFGEIRRALGERLFTSLRQSTEQLISATGEALQSLERSADDLTRAFRDEFPNRGIIELARAERGEGT